MTARTKTALLLTAGGVVINAVLAFIKLFVGIRTNSLCIMLDSMNGFFDTATGLITVTAFLLCAMPKSEKYPYGKGRSEYVAGFAVSVAAAVMGVLFFFDSISRIFMPEPVWFGLESCILISIGIPVKLGMAIVYGISGKKLKSKALKAIMADSFLDVGITSATVASFTLASQVNYAVDSIFGIIISCVVTVCAVKMIADNLGTLTGAADCKEEREAVIGICKEIPEVTAIKRMKLHDYGYRACHGTVEIVYKDGTGEEKKKETAETIKRKIKEETGAEIDFIISEEKSGENGEIAS